MGFESFNPADQKYKTIQDLPPALQEGFRDVSDGGFVRKEVVRYESDLARRAQESGTKITTDELAAQDAEGQDAKIATAVAQKIGSLESSLGVSLTEEAKRQIYSKAASEVLVSTQERYDRHAEQGRFMNNQIDTLAQEIAVMSMESIQALPSREKREKLSLLADFDRFVPNAVRTDMLDVAAKKLLEGYRSSGELKQLHENAHASVMGRFEPARILEIRFQWNTYSQDEKLALCQEVVDTLATSYGLPKNPEVKIPLQASEDTREPLAEYVQGKVLIIDFERTFSSFDQMAAVMAHEIAHAHQEKLVQSTNEVEGDADVLLGDKEWFALDERLERVYNREFYEQNYRSMAKEQDAFSAGEMLEGTMREYGETIMRRWNEVLAEAGFFSTTEMGNQAHAIGNAEVVLAKKDIADGDELIRILENEYLIDSKDCEEFFRGKTTEECREEILNFRRKLKQAIELYPQEAA